jgi:hypothetical protein
MAIGRGGNLLQRTARHAPSDPGNFSKNPPAPSSSRPSPPHAGTPTCRFASRNRRRRSWIPDAAVRRILLLWRRQKPKVLHSRETTVREDAMPPGRHDDGVHQKPTVVHAGEATIKNPWPSSDVQSRTPLEASVHTRQLPPVLHARQLPAAAVQERQALAPSVQECQPLAHAVQARQPPAVLYARQLPVDAVQARQPPPLVIQEGQPQPAVQAMNSGSPPSRG